MSRYIIQFFSLLSSMNITHARNTYMQHYGQSDWYRMTGLQRFGIVIAHCAGMLFALFLFYGIPLLFVLGLLWINFGVL